MSAWEVYLFTRLSAVNIISVILLVVFGLTGFLLTLFGFIEEEPEQKKLGKWSLFIAGISMLLLVIIPTTKEAAAIYLIPKLINNEQVQKIPENAAKLLNAKLDEWIEDSLGKKEKE